MATEKIVNPFTVPASGDLSSYQYHIMTLNTDGQAKVADDADDTAEALIGILLDKPTVANQSAKIAGPGSIVKLIADESINEGSRITCSEDGTDKGQGIATTTAGDNYVGISLTASGDAEFFEVLVQLGVHGGT